MQPMPIEYESMPHMLVEALQHAARAPKPGIAAGAGQFFFGGGTSQVPVADTQPQVIAVEQHGVASIALGRNILSIAMAPAAGLVHVVAPQGTDVTVAPAPPAPAVAADPPSGALVPPVGVVGVVPVLLPQPRPSQRLAIRTPRVVIFIVNYSALLGFDVAALSCLPQSVELPYPSVRESYSRTYSARMQVPNCGEKRARSRQNAAVSGITLIELSRGGPLRGLRKRARSACKPALDTILSRLHMTKRGRPLLAMRPPATVVPTCELELGVCESLTPKSGLASKSRVQSECLMAASLS
jgi:hypothetical protein